MAFVENNIDDSLSNWCDLFSSAVSDHVRTRRVRNTSRFDHPWLDPELLRLQFTEFQLFCILHIRTLFVSLLFVRINLVLFASDVQVVCIFEYCFDVLVILSINLSKLLRVSDAVLLFGKLAFCAVADPGQNKSK